MTGERTWLEGIKAKRRRQYLKALAFLLAAEFAWLGAVALCVWAWVNVFHRLPPDWLSLKIFVGIGSAIMAPLGAFAPLAPMKGPDPEVIAADEFFHRDGN